MNPKKKKQLRKLFAFLRTGVEPLESTDQLESGIKQLTGKLKKQMKAESLEEVNKVLGEFQKKIDLGPIKKSLEDLKGSNGGIYKDLQEKISTFFASFSSRLENGLLRLDNEQTASNSNKDGLTRLEKDFKGKSTILESVKTLSETNAVELSSLAEELRGFVKELNKDLLTQSLEGKRIDKEVKDLLEALRKLRQELLGLIANVGGGNMNRNIAIGGNASALSRYTDINIRAGSNVTLTYSNNDTTKYLDLTIAATGGSGITREVNTTTVSSTVGSVAGIDYVTLANGGVRITMPPAAGNTNLYTIKNIGVSSVMIVAAGAETFDGDTNIIMPVRYTSVDLNSDNTNWHIT